MRTSAGDPEDSAADLIEPKRELFDGKVAVVADPTGAAIGLLEWSGEQPKGNQTP